MLSVSMMRYYFESWCFRRHGLFVNGQICRDLSDLGFQDFFCGMFEE